MINVWGTDCGPCIQEMPDLAALHEAYADKGVQVVGLVSDALGMEAAYKRQPQGRPVEPLL